MAPANNRFILSYASVQGHNFIGHAEWNKFNSIIKIFRGLSGKLYERDRVYIAKRVQMEQVLITAKGITGQLDLLEDKVRIKRRTGFYAIVTQGFRADKNIPFDEITSVVFREAGMLNGFIEIVVKGNQPKQGLMDAALDPFTITFKVRHQAAFEKIKKAIEEKLAVLKHGSSEK